jgi:hypothetical protein
MSYKLGDFRHQMLRGGDIRTHAVVGGDGPPLVLRHGFPQTWWEWRKIMPLLAERHTVKEFLADTFAGFILMPIIGLRRAFAARGWTPETATPAQIFTIACEFGVGYATLLTHLSAGVNMLSCGRGTVLQRVTRKALRMNLLGTLMTPEPLIVADRHRAAPTLDAEVKTKRS